MAVYSKNRLIFDGTILLLGLLKLEYLYFTIEITLRVPVASSPTDTHTHKKIRSQFFHTITPIRIATQID